MTDDLYQRGDRVVLRAFRGELITRRVWEDKGAVVVICSERSYQDAIRDGTKASCVGWRREDVLGLARTPVSIP